MFERRGAKSGKRSKFWRVLRWGLAAIAILLAPVFLWNGFLYWRVTERLGDIREAGLPTNYAEVQEWREPVPPGENAAPLLFKLAEQIQPPSEAEAEYLPIVGEFHFEGEPWEPLPSRALETADAYLRKNAGVVEGIHEAVQRNHYRIPAAWNSVEGLDYLTALRRITRHLVLRAELAAADADGAMLAQVLVNGYRLTALLGEENDMIVQLTRIAIQHMLHNAFQRGLSQCKMSEEQLLSVAESLDSTGAPDVLQNILIAERASAQNYFTFQSLLSEAGITSPQEFSEYIFGDAKIEDATMLYSQLYGVLMRDRIFYLDTVESWLEMAVGPYPQQAKLLAQMQNDVNAIPEWARVSQMLLLWFPEVADSCILYEARRRMARTAIALELHRLRHDALPETLTELQTASSSGFLTNPYTGDMMSYMPAVEGAAPTPPSYALYCPPSTRPPDLTARPSTGLTIYLPD